MYLRRLIKAKQQSQLSWQNSDLLKKIKQSANPSSVSRFHIKIVTAVLDIRRNPLKLLCPPVQVNAGLGRQTPSVAQPARSSMSQSSSRAGSHQGHIIIQKKTDCSEAVPGRQGEEKDKHCKERSIKGRRPETASALRKSIERGTVEASLKPQGEKKIHILSFQLLMQVTSRVSNNQDHTKHGLPGSIKDFSSKAKLLSSPEH